MFAKLINESLRDKLVGPTNDQIIENIYNLTPEQKTYELIKAINKNKPKIIWYLLDSGVDINDADKDDKFKYTPLMYAILFYSTNIIDLLLEYKPDVNIKNVVGRTALHYAASSGQITLVKKLLKLGADKNIKDNDEKTAYDYAKENSHDITARLLKNYK